jgi:hypothetical protein
MKRAGTIAWCSALYFDKQKRTTNRLNVVRMVRPKLFSRKRTGVYMKKYLILTVLFGLSASAYADQYYVAANGESLSITDDGTATLDSSCGGGTIRDFQVNGQPMTETTFGGLPGVQPQTLTVSATSLGHNIILNRPIFRFHNYLLRV